MVVHRSKREAHTTAVRVVVERVAGEGLVGSLELDHKEFLLGDGVEVVEGGVVAAVVAEVVAESTVGEVVVDIVGVVELEEEA